MAKKAKYSEYSENTQQFMGAVEKFIKTKYGKLELHWQGELDLLATNFEIFMQAKEEIRTRGLLIPNRFGSLEKNPLLRVLTDANIQCFKIVQEFGLSPMSNGKVKEKEVDDTTDVIKGLLDG